MTNIIKNIYDSVVDHIEEHFTDYLDEYNSDNNTMIPSYKNIYRQYVDIYDLPSYPSIVFGYGEITMADEHTTTAEHWQVPLSVYVVNAGADAKQVHEMCEVYEFILFAIFSGEDYDNGIVNVSSMGVSPAMMRENNVIQVGYVDITIDVSVNRKN